MTRKPVEEFDVVELNASKVRKAPLNAPGNGDFMGHLSGHTDPINDLLHLIRETPSADYASLSQRLQVSEVTVKRYIQKLKQENRLRRIGSKKTGHWEIIE